MTSLEYLKAEMEAMFSGDKLDQTTSIITSKDFLVQVDHFCYTHNIRSRAMFFRAAARKFIEEYQG